MGNSRIQADPRWDIFFQVKTHEDFVERFVPTVYLHPTVNIEIRGIFDSIQRKLVASYFDYETVDDAAHKAVFSLEMALKLRYYEMHQEPVNKKISLQDLLKHFQKEGYFEIDNIHYFDRIRSVRNHFAHPAMHTFGGLNSLQYILMVADLINDLYENRVLRKLRKFATEFIDRTLSDFTEKGAKIQLASGDESIVYHCLVGLINNVEYPNIITLLYKPIFPIPPNYKATDSIQLHSWLTAVCNEFIVLPDKLIGLDKDGQEVFRISNLQGLSANNKWNLWKTEFDAYRQVMHLFDHADYNDVGEILAALKISFHKRDCKTIGNPKHVENNFSSS